MTDHPADHPADFVAAWPQSQPQPPGTVVTAVVLTWITATCTAALTLFLAVVFLWLGAPVFEVFDEGAGNPRWFVVGAAAIVVTFCAAADAMALFVLRGKRWACWALSGFCLVAAIGGVFSAYYVAPLLVTVAAVLVAVLLALPSARGWRTAPVG